MKTSQPVKVGLESLLTPENCALLLGAELQRDWARTATVAELSQMLVDHMGNFGTSFTWEQQLLATPPAKKTA